MILFISQSFYTPDEYSYYVIPESYAHLSSDALIDLYEMGDFSKQWELELDDSRKMPACTQLIHYIYEA